MNFHCLTKIVWLVLLSLVPFSNSIAQQYGQNINYYAFDTNGPMGECLFPINDKGEDEIKKVIEYPGKSAKEISEKVQQWMYEITDKYNLKIENNDRFCGTDLVAFRGTVKLGLSVLSVSYGFAHIGNFARYASEIKFSCRVEIKDGKCRCIFNKFMTDRRTIRGEGKSNGPENRLHWQRMNSLIAERDDIIDGKTNLSKSKQEEVDALNEQIRFEEETYKLEYKTFCDMLDALKNVFVDKYDF